MKICFIFGIGSWKWYFSVIFVGFFVTVLSVFCGIETDGYWNEQYLYETFFKYLHFNDSFLKKKSDGFLFIILKIVKNFFFFFLKNFSVIS